MNSHRQTANPEIIATFMRIAVTIQIYGVRSTNVYNEADNLMTQSAKKGGKINPQKSQD